MLFLFLNESFRLLYCNENLTYNSVIFTVFDRCGVYCKGVWNCFLWNFMKVPKLCTIKMRSTVCMHIHKSNTLACLLSQKVKRAIPLYCVLCWKDKNEQMRRHLYVKATQLDWLEHTAVRFIIRVSIFINWMSGCMCMWGSEWGGLTLFACKLGDRSDAAMRLRVDSKLQNVGRTCQVLWIAYSIFISKLQAMQKTPKKKRKNISRMQSVGYPKHF